jgi:hypothetical protein
MLPVRQFCRGGCTFQRSAAEATLFADRQLRAKLAAKVKRAGSTAALVQAGRMMGSSSSAFFRALYEPEIAKLSRSKHAQGVQRLIELFAVCGPFEPAYNDYLRKQRNSE